MLRSIKKFLGFPIEATDGAMGKARDMLFDDHYWTVRYLVADTGNWLRGRKVLISPFQFAHHDPGAYQKSFPVTLTRSQVEGCPPLEADAPVSLQYEQELAEFYSIPIYWEGGQVWGIYPVPLTSAPPSPAKVAEHEKKLAEIRSSHLRSAGEVFGYRIHAVDGEIGHVEDLVVDCGAWTIRYLVVDTVNWLPGRKVLVAPSWILKVSWPKRTLDVTMSRDAIKGSPPFDPKEPVNRDYEGQLYDYYGVPRYWSVL